MAKKKTRSRSLADPIDLSPRDDSDTVQVIIETPKGNRSKYAFDEKQRVFALKEGIARRYDVSVRLRFHSLDKS
jgi:hypothetical protein